jgi:hypothetical protein
MAKHVEPTISKTAFSCPHCDTLASQKWYNVIVDEIYKDDKLPHLWDLIKLKDFRKNSQDKGAEPTLLEWLSKVQTFTEKGTAFISENTDSHGQDVDGLHISECYECKELSIWLRGKLISPNYLSEIETPHDLPDNIKPDFREAASIVNQSPRGAAALLRLCIQKLMPHLGEKGKDINVDIASLVQKGLNPNIQKSLDAVRVIGNESVHPGEMDIRDDKETVLILFRLVAAIVNQTITYQKENAAIYGLLPENKLKAIEKRDKSAA